jgi:hypothetical protein
MEEEKREEKRRECESKIKNQNIYLTLPWICESSLHQDIESNLTHPLPPPFPPKRI